MDERLLNVKEAAAILNIAPPTLYEKVSKKIIPCIQLWEGKKKACIRFKREDLQRFITSRTVKPSRSRQ